VADDLVRIRMETVEEGAIDEGGRGAAVSAPAAWLA